jgi:hypothetical protein
MQGSVVFKAGWNVMGLGVYVGIRKMGEEKVIGDNTGDNSSTDIDKRSIIRIH